MMILARLRISWSWVLARSYLPYVWATSSKHLRCSVVLQRAIDALTNVWWQGVKSITQQNCRATSCEAGNSYPGKAVLWVIMMVTFSDIVTCHIFGNSCDLWYTQFNDLLYIMHPWNTGLWEDQSLQIHLVVPNSFFWDAQKIIKKHLPTLLQQAGNFPPKKNMVCYLKLPTWLQMFSGLLDSTWPSDSTVASGSVPRDLPRNVQALPGRPSRALGSAAIDPATSGVRHFLQLKAANDGVGPLDFGGWSNHPKKSWESFHAPFLPMRCHGGKGWDTHVCWREMESTSLHGCNWVLLGNELDWFRRNMADGWTL